jgi:hypothetical protein
LPLSINSKSYFVIYVFGFILIPTYIPKFRVVSQIYTSPVY